MALTAAVPQSDISMGASGVALTFFCAIDWFLMVFSAWKPLKFANKATSLRSSVHSNHMSYSMNICSGSCDGLCDLY